MDEYTDGVDGEEPRLVCWALADLLAAWTVVAMFAWTVVAMFAWIVVSAVSLSWSLFF